MEDKLGWIQTGVAYGISVFLIIITVNVGVNIEIKYAILAIALGFASMGLASSNYIIARKQFSRYHSETTKQLLKIESELKRLDRQGK